ncbi:hypothetical protein AX16_002786 [Volvariella volvacea WC 439]|nr:hypothetical protein AX16_002786 [Volvariella volvacea WC 439]
MTTSLLASDGPDIPHTAMGGLLDDYPPVDNRSCQLLGPTALVVQGLMGILVISSLIYKRHRENPRRPWRIWLFDVSKQVVGQMFVHGVNLLVSNVGSNHTAGNACVFYFLNILIDTTLGVGMIYVMLHFFTYLVSEKWGLKGFESGVYGSPPSFKYWIRQAAIYVFSLTTMKMVVLGLLLIPGILNFGEWLLSWTWTEDGDDVQVIFTVGIFPIIMNIVQFWLIDSIVKASGGAAVALDTTDAHYEPLSSEPLFQATDDEDGNESSSEIHDIENQRNTTRINTHHTELKGTGGALLATPSTVTALGGYSYPPSTSTSPTRETSPTSVTKMKKMRRRSPPRPLNLLGANPAINSPIITASSPQPTPASSSANHRPQPTPSQLGHAAPPEQNNDWADSWEDSDDWADRVGEEEWTGKRIEETKNSINNTWQDHSATNTAFS